jgi:hypothetical protein
MIENKDWLTQAKHMEMFNHNFCKGTSSFHPKSLLEDRQTHWMCDEREINLRFYELFIYLNFTWVTVAFSSISHWLTHVRCEVALCSTAYHCVHYAIADIIYVPWLFYTIHCWKVLVITLTYLSSNW